MPKGCGGCRSSPIPVRSPLWRAVCCESSLHGSGRGGWVRLQSLMELPIESSIWKVMLGVSGMRLETAFPGV